MPTPKKYCDYLTVETLHIRYFRTVGNFLHNETLGSETIRKFHFSICKHRFIDFGENDFSICYWIH